MNILFEKFKEVIFSVLPITVIVLVLHFTLTNLETPQLIRFLFGALLIIIGLSIFLVGVDKGITPIGNLMGATLTKTNKIWIVGVAGLILGFFISIAEPDLHILAGQVDFVTGGVIPKFTIVVIVSVGIAALLTLGLIRIVYNIPLYKLLSILYLIVFVLAIFTSPEFLAISFDASGATTGALTVPFILALALGVSTLKKDSKASEKDSFGLVAITSVGAIIAVMVMNIIAGTDEISGSLEYSAFESASIIAPFIHELPIIAGEIILALLPIIILFIVFQKISFKLPRRSIHKIIKGLVYTFLGLVLFLVGVNAGFMDVGSVIGYSVASLENKSYVVIIGFVLGLVTILAEPAVHVLTHQIEEVTSGYVKRKVVLVALSIGVGAAIALSMVRIIITEVQLWHYLLPGYIIAIAMSYFVPKLFVGIAFDSGGVASGPMTAAFILAFAQGVAEAIEGADVLREGFGMIAMVALTPLIALQTLGFIFKIKSAKGGMEADGATELSR
ncbi:DUF1538 domain-containing protein [Pelotomaculum terephthalicicum JT]|uniref:DUF1538 domain-containing protein n=1 Tax=Pelotomaculum TaxID=191373 RepID=UPI0009CB1209|nr:MULTISPECIES: DUF1538 domain-containing protein [Pelotomaculum]MCG9967296.1 DUF1538 domain-containing protein [Pelotomaculum terephthalicicum JT]OPX86890.1 MAG: hypothetical protein A4E54_01921 [Pelotomaculum sp. PtaB.Bin117]